MICQFILCNLLLLICILGLRDHKCVKTNVFLRGNLKKTLLSQYCGNKKRLSFSLLEETREKIIDLCLERKISESITLVFRSGGIRTDKFHLHMQKPRLSKIFQLFEYFDQNHRRFKKRSIGETLHIKNQANNIKLV